MFAFTKLRAIYDSLVLLLLIGVLGQCLDAAPYSEEERSNRDGQALRAFLSYLEDQREEGNITSQGVSELRSKALDDYLVRGTIPTYFPPRACLIEAGRDFKASLVASYEFLGNSLAYSISDLRVTDGCLLIQPHLIDRLRSSNNEARRYEIKGSIGIQVQVGTHKSMVIDLDQIEPDKWIHLDLHSYASKGNTCDALLKGIAPQRAFIAQPLYDFDPKVVGRPLSVAKQRGFNSEKYFDVIEKRGLLGFKGVEVVVTSRVDVKGINLKEILFDSTLSIDDPKEKLGFGPGRATTTTEVFSIAIEDFLETGFSHMVMLCEKGDRECRGAELVVSKDGTWSFVVEVPQGGDDE